MNTLRILGGLWLEQADSTTNGRSMQRQRLALLVAIWLSPNRRITRDKVLALLWPESTATEGRHRLSTAIYDVRRALGSDSVRSSGDELWIPPDTLLSCDVDHFERAIAQAEWETAAATYRGPLLDGVHLPRLYEFDEWISSQRERLRRLYACTLEHLIDTRQLPGGSVDAVDVARRLSEVEPLSERVALLAASAVARGGDRVEAVALLERFVARVDRELGVPQPPAVGQLLREMRTIVDALPDAAAAPTASRTLLQSPIIPQRSDRARDTRRRPSRRRHVLIATGTALVLMTAVGVAYARRALPTADGVTVQLRNDAEPTLSASIAQSVRQQLGAALIAIGACSEGGPLAARAGDHCLVQTHIGANATGLTIRAALQSQTSGASLASAEVALRPDRIDASVSALARDLVAGALLSTGNDLAAAAVRSTSSAAAMHAFLIGDGQYRHGFFPAARLSFETAIAADSTFALAHYRLSQTLLWEDAPSTLAERHDRLALHYATDMSQNERDVVQAYVAWRTGEAARAESLYGAVLTRNPRYVEARFQLAETRFHYNAPRGRRIEEAAGEFGWVLELDSTHWGAKWHLALLDAAHIPQATMHAHIDALLAGHTDGYIAEELRLFAADSGMTLARLAEHANATVLFDAAWRRAIYRRDLDGAEALLLAMSRGDRPRLDQSKAMYLVAALRFGRGRVREALAMLPLRHPPVEADEALVIAVTATVAGDLHEGLADRDSLFQIVSAWQQTARATGMLTLERRANAAYLLGVLAAARGNMALAHAQATALDSIDADALTPHRLAAIVRAAAARQRGRCDDALVYLDRSTTPIWLGIAASSATASGSLDRYLRADCFARMGRHQEAIAWFTALEQHTLYDLALLRPALLGQVRSYRALGDTRSAEETVRRMAAW